MAIATGRPPRPSPTWTAMATSTSTSVTTGLWDAEHPKLCKDPTGTRYLSCDPRAIEAMPDHVFRNDAGKFVDVTRESGMAEQGGRGLGVVAADLDDDGRIDVFVANDTTANDLFHNLGGFHFEEIGTIAGVAANAAGGYQAGMGVACGDLDGDGRLDLAVTNFYLESNVVLPKSRAECLRRSDRRDRAGRTEPPSSRLRHRLPGCEQRRPSRPDDRQRSHQRHATAHPAGDVGAALRRRRGRRAEGRHRTGRPALRGAPRRPGAGRRRPRQRRPARRPDGRPERAARPPSTIRPSPAITSSRFVSRGRSPTATASGRGSPSRPAAVARSPGASAEGAMPHPVIPGSISGSGRAGRSIPSKSGGPRDESTVTRISRPTPAITSGKETPGRGPSPGSDDEHDTQPVIRSPTRPAGCAAPFRLLRPGRRVARGGVAGLVQEHRPHQPPVPDEPALRLAGPALESDPVLGHGNPPGRGNQALGPARRLAQPSNPLRPRRSAGAAWWPVLGFTRRPG